MSADDTRPDLSVPLDERAAFRAAEDDAAAPAVTSPAPAPGSRSGSATARSCACSHDGWYDPRCACCNRGPGQPPVDWKARAEAAEARLAGIEAHASAITDALRHALSYVEHVPGPSSQAAAGRYRSALAIIAEEGKS